MKINNLQSIKNSLAIPNTFSNQYDPPKSQIEKSLLGELFDVYSEKWKISTRITLRIDQLSSLFAPELLEGLIMTLSHYARNKSPSTCQAIISSLRNYAKTIFPKRKINNWLAADFKNYRKLLVERYRHESYLNDIRAFLKTWYELRHPGVCREVYISLNAMRLKHSEAGRAVRTMDPVKGPLEPVEFHTLTKDIYHAYEQGIIDLEKFSISLFHIATGRRPSQSAAIKCKDIEIISTSQENFINQVASKKEDLRLIHVPRLKQQGAIFRDEFRSIEWTTELFALFRLQQKITQISFTSLLDSFNWNLQSIDVSDIKSDLPLFPDWKRINASLVFCSSLNSKGEHALALQKLRLDSAGSQWHRTGQSITAILQTSANSAGSHSRTGEKLKISALRLRHTKGTNLAREGLGKDIIAWLLDHSTLEAVKIYTNNLPEHAIPVNAAMALSPTMQDIAQLFRGKIVDSEKKAFGGTKPQTSRLHFKGKGTATCGTHKQCGMGSRIPLCCYECDYFQPWLDGPHMEVLTDLLNERKQREITLGPDHTVTKNADSTIIAVINVIQQCEMRSQKLSIRSRKK